MPMATTTNTSSTERIARIFHMRIVPGLLLLLTQSVLSAAGAVAMLDHTQQYTEEAAGREVVT